MCVSVLQQKSSVIGACQAFAGNALQFVGIVIVWSVLLQYPSVLQAINALHMAMTLMNQNRLKLAAMSAL